MSATMPPGQPSVMKLVDGLRFTVGPDEWLLEPMWIPPGSWVALIPEESEPKLDPSGRLSRILTTMSEPERGTVEILGNDVYKLEYGKRQRLRARIGFVHGYGGLLSNRTVRDNIALPVSVHGGLSASGEAELVDRTVEEFALTPVAGLHPHEMDGATRWRACLARALVLGPSWLVLEGLGNWEMDRGRGTGWVRLMERRKNMTMGTALCLPRKNPEFEAWFEEQEGTIVRYPRIRHSLMGGPVA